MGGCGRFGFHDGRGAEGLTEGAFDELGAVDFHRGKRAERGAEGGSVHGEGFLGGLAADEFGGEAGDGDGGFAAEGLEGGAIDDFPAALVAEFHPHAQHIAAVRAADGADGVGVGHRAEVCGGRWC